MSDIQGPPAPSASLEVAALETPSASEGVARVIRGLILSGELAPGDWLPPSRELAKMLGVSVLTLRLGLRELESTGYVVTSRGAHGGTRVNDMETLGRMWVEWTIAKGDEVRGMWEFRDLVETNIAALAAERRTEEELAAIESALTVAWADSHTAVLRWNVVFHDALAVAAHNPLLTRAMVSVRSELFLPVGLLLREHPADELRVAHAQVFEAVRAHDSVRAAEGMRNHLEGTKDMVRQALEELLASAETGG